MSWGTCYAGSNNIHFNYPPLMSDGRNYASWEPGAVINNNLKAQANIKTNAEYRQYLINNADDIIKLNQMEACNNCGCCPYYDTTKQSSNQPYLYNSCLSRDQPYGYENSNLKRLYLSREQLAILKSEPITFKLR